MLASEYGRYGYRRIWGLLDRAGWRVNLKRIARIWRREGLRVPQKQPQRGRLWLADGSCLRLRPCWCGTGSPATPELPLGKGSEFVDDGDAAVGVFGGDDP